jgi:DNA-binding NarL/FixJ family response regulator
MLERAQVAGGWCRIESRPGRTKVEIWVPERVPEDEPARRAERVSLPDSGVVGAEEATDEALASRGLTAREIQVARLLALGHTNAEIAASLYLWVRTIEHHRASVFRKLGVNSRAALVSEMNDRSVPERD